VRLESGCKKIPKILLELIWRAPKSGVESAWRLAPRLDAAHTRGDGEELGVLATANIFEFEEFRLDRRGEGLFRRDEDGVFVPVSIGPRALDILAVLVERAGALVSKEEIMAAVWGRAVVENANLTVQISTLRRILDQGRTEGSCIHTVAARGYRFIPAVRVTHGGRRTSGTPQVPRMSIVVLPFTNLSDDPEQRYFADGLVDDLTTDLSRIDGMFVISRNTAFTYQGRAINAKQISHELGVRFVLEGSARRSGSQLRVNAQLIDAETGAHLWAERFDRDFGELFALQNEITSRIAVALDIELVGAEAARPTERPDALDYILRGRAASWRSPTPEKYAETIGFFDCALALDPLSVEAKSLLAAALANRVLDRMTDIPVADLGRAEALISQALSAAPRNPRVHYARAELLRVVRRNQEAIPEYETAIAFNRNWADALAGLGWCKFWTGWMEEAIWLHGEAMRLSPRDPLIGYWYHRIGVIRLLQSRTEEAISWFERARGMIPTFPLVYSFLGSAYALNGEPERGAALLVETYWLSGNVWVSTIADMRITGYWGPPKIRDLCESIYFAGLRKLGVPEE
jgi:TolB-like protein/Tfp pilus assembly protein PilF